MNELNLSIYTGNGADAADPSKAKGNSVTLTAKFSGHEEAVRFHEGLSKLCREYSSSATPLARWGTKLLTKS